jgi:thymidine phosphorylase
MGEFLYQELIQKKRDGLALADREIQAFVAGITSGAVSDAQIAAMAMATWFQDMNLREKTVLTLAMRDSGHILQWDDLGGPVLDKHSTGGVGDLVSLILGPLMAACGAYVPMISGRGLGHTGGTLDKLESIPGFATSLGVSQFQSLVRATGIAIVGQTDELAPADRRFYAVRDVTATVASVPLIVASILCKKLAEGLDGLVMDVKVGTGAFMRETGEAQNLARTLTQVSMEAGLPCSSLITDMNLPLAWSAGNALEVREAIEYLSGRARHPRLDETVRALGIEMILLGGLAENIPCAKKMISDRLDSGQAAEYFARMVAGQGGPADLLEQPDRYLKQAEICRPVFPQAEGYVSAMDTRSLGIAVVELGGGRNSVEDRINPSVGLGGLCMAAQKVDAHTPLATIHAANEADWRRAEARIRSAVTIAEHLPGVPPLVHECVK